MFDLLQDTAINNCTFGITSSKALHFTSLNNPGGLPERPMGGDCKSPGSAFEGSNPSPATKKLKRVLI